MQEEKRILFYRSERGVYVFRWEYGADEDLARALHELEQAGVLSSADVGGIFTLLEAEERERTRFGLRM